MREKERKITNMRRSFTVTSVEKILKKLEKRKKDKEDASLF